MPILIRPVREQLEHDRVIRALQAKWKRKFDAQINPGEERGASIKVGTNIFFPDLVLFSLTSPKRVQGVVEVETGESVNNLEAMAQWANFGKAKVPFQLYVPAGSLDIARRLCEEHQVVPAEIWTFIQLGDQMRFTLAQRNASTEPPRAEKAAPARKPVRPAKPAKTAKVRKAALASKRAAAAKRPAKRAAARPAAARRTAARKTGTRPAVGRAQKRR